VAASKIADTKPASKPADAKAVAQAKQPEAKKTETKKYNKR
jgi:hypothetical protein